MKNQTKRNSQLRRYSSFFSMLILLAFLAFPFISKSQQIDNYAPKKRYTVCLQLNGTTCGSTTTCLSQWDQWSKKDPCTLNNFYYFEGDPPVKKKAVCCGYEWSIEKPADSDHGLLSYHGYPMYLAFDTFQLKVSCDDGGGNTHEEIVADFTASIPAAWQSVVLNAFIANDTVVIEAYEGDTLAPYYKMTSKITIKYGPSVISNACSNAAVPMMNSTGIQFIRTAKVTTSFTPNPLKSNMLKYELVNDEAINENLVFTFYNSLGQIVFEYIPKSEAGEIDLSILPNGVYTVLMHSSYEQESSKIVIDRR